MSVSEIDNMQKAGLAKMVGNEVEVTAKGSEIIKVMILGDDRSVFEDTPVVIDYNQALSNTKNLKTAKKSK